MATSHVSIESTDINDISSITAKFPGAVVAGVVNGSTVFTVPAADADALYEYVFDVLDVFAERLS